MGVAAASSRAPVLLATLAAFAAGLSACGSGETTTAQSTSGEAAAPPTESTVTDAEPATQGSGSDAKDGGLSDEEQISAAIEALLLSKDSASVCDEVVSAEFLKVAYGDVEGCLNARAPATIADSIKSLDGPEIEGDTATAVAVTRGGLYAGEPLDLVLVKEGGAWRVESLVADIPAGP